ncbi:hypothetical protein [Clostridium butyricum]
MCESNCPICRENDAKIIRDKERDIEEVSCKYCGKFKITDEAIEMLHGAIYKSQLAKISSLIKSRDIDNKPIITIYSNDADIDASKQQSIKIESLLLDYPKTMAQRIDNALINLSSLSKYTGQFIKFATFKNASTVLYCDSYESSSVTFILDYLQEQGMIDFKFGRDSRTAPMEFRLTVEAWSKINEYLEGHNSSNAFVAMSFDTDLNSIYDSSIKRAIVDAGYSPIRVDKKEFNDKICDEIVINVRKSKFIVADVTQQKNGVYFEAGFAMGLGKPVIWTVKHSDLDNIHFDTRQYNHIVWEDEKDLYEKLKKRILATIV